MAPSHGHRLVAVGCFEDMIAAPPQCFPDEGSNGLLIFSQENRLAASTGWSADSVPLRQAARINAGKEYLERGSGAHFTAHIDPAPVLPYDAVDRRKPQAGSLARFFGSEERLEDPLPGRLVHTVSVVRHRHQDVAS